VDRKTFKKKSLEIELLGGKISKLKKELKSKDQTLPNLYALYGYLLANDIGIGDWQKSLLDVIHGLEGDQNG